jgi:3-hydroxyisobutyrate dehydrogenase
VPAQDLRALGDQCDLIMSCLPTSSQVRDVIFGANGLAGHLKPGSIMVDMTTGDPTATRAMAAELKARDLHLIDAPVSGGPHGAAADINSLIRSCERAAQVKIVP